MIWIPITRSYRCGIILTSNNKRKKLKKIEERKNRWLMYSFENDKLYEESSKTRYELDLDAGILDMTGIPVWEKRYELENQSK